MAAPVPAGFGLEADPRLERLDDGRLLVGGSPLRIVRLTDPGARLLDGWFAGEPLSQTPSERALARRLLDAAMVHPRPAPGGSVALDDATMVIPVRDDAAGLADLLAALEGSVATVVVDDASRDGDAIAATARRFGARLVVRSVNGGPGEARNSGLAEAATAVVVFADADAVVDPPVLRALLDHLADPSVVAAAPRVQSRPGSGLLAAYEAVHSPLDMGEAGSPVGPDRRVRYVPGAVLAVRADAARRIGGFDGSLRWGEDVDFVWRLLEEGDTVRYVPGAVAWHRPRASWPAWIEQRRRYGASAAALAVLHGTAAAPVRCSSWSALAWGSAVAGRHGVAASTVAARTALMAARLRPVASSTSVAAGGRRPADGRGASASGRLALRLSLRSHGLAGRGLARAVTRAWLPLALVGAVMFRRLRPVVAGAALAPPLVEWLRGCRPAGPAVSAGLRIADDIAYCAGVWEGMAARRNLGAIRPDFSPGLTAQALATVRAPASIASGRNEHQSQGRGRADRAGQPRRGRRPAARSAARSGI